MKYIDFFKHTDEIEKKIGYSFKDKSLLAQAFTRTSFCNENKTSNDTYQSNEVLEFLGDSVLSAAVATMLISENSERYRYGIRTDFGEGDFSNIKSRLSDKTNLSASIKKLKLQNFLLMGDGDVKLSIQNEPSVAEDLFESILGAVYIDSGKKLESVAATVAKILDVSVYLNTERKGAVGSYKNILQEFCADKSRRLPPPVYEVASEGPEHELTYYAVCIVGNEVYGKGVGKNKKSAECDAARVALENLRAEVKSAVTERRSPQESARKYARERGVKTPEYHDLGETEASTKTRPEFRVECLFCGKSAIGIGVSKKEARDAAVDKIMRSLKK